MHHKVQLLVSKWCPTCPQAEQLWFKISEEKNIELKILDVSDRSGREMVTKLMIKSIPATIIDGKLAFIGVPSIEKAQKAVSE